MQAPLPFMHSHMTNYLERERERGENVRALIGEEGRTYFWSKDVVDRASKVNV